MLTMKEYGKRVFVTLLIILATIVIPAIIYKLFPHFVPFIFAYLTALALEPLRLWLMKMLRIKQRLSSVITYLLFLGTLGVLVYLTIYKVYVELVDLLSYIQSHATDIEAWIFALTENIQDTIGLLRPEAATQVNQVILSAINSLSDINLVTKLGTYTYTLTTAVPNFIFLLLMYLISLFLFLDQLDLIHRGFYSFFKDSSKRKVLYVFADLKNASFGFLKAQIILSTVTFLICFFALLFLKVKYAAVLALVVTIVDILPILGTGSVLMPWALVTLFQGNVVFAVSLMILYLVIVIVRKIIEPKILGERLGLNSLVTLISIWVGFKVLGILGIFLFPLAVIFYQTLVKINVIKINKLKF